MSDPDARQPENVSGKYYVDENCNACGVCVSTAENNFSMTDDEEHAYVSKQPEGEEELQAVLDALDGCPEGAICDDGE